MQSLPPHDLDAAVPVPAGRGTLLIHAPLPVFRQPGGGWLVERQALNGLRLWAENFDRVIATMLEDSGPPPPGWGPLQDLGPDAARIEIVALPTAWRPDRFLRQLRPTLPVLRAAMARADYLSFAIGGFTGDWGAVGCIEAHRQGRPYAVWTDRVESAVMRHAARHGPHWRERLRARLLHRPAALLERHVIRRATLGLFHGRETFEAYAPLCRNPQIVHDVHVRSRDHISPQDLALKLADAAKGPLRLVYAGRAVAMKGPRDWLAVLDRLAAEGIDFTAAWLGDGPELPAMRARVEAAGLAGRVELHGHIEDHGAVISALRQAHALLFCHQAPESPRILIEALISGTPLLGYGSPYPEELIEGHGGGVLVGRGDVAALAAAAGALARDRGRLAALIAAAAKDGTPFDDRSLFRHRSDIIRRHLPPPAGRGRQSRR